MTYILAEAAAEDLIDILADGAEMYGETIARAYHNGLHETFELLGSVPELAQLRTELTPPARIHRSQSPYLMYQAGFAGGTAAPADVRPVRVDTAGGDPAAQARLR